MRYSDIARFAKTVASALATFGSPTVPRDHFVPKAPRRPTGQALRNPNDPHQAARIQAAADKRARKAAKLTSNTLASHRGNRAHSIFGSVSPNGNGEIVPCRLHPFYVNR